MDGLIGLFLLLISAFSMFKFRQNKGKNNFNDVMISVGEGSFFNSMKYGFFNMFWVVIFILSFFGGISLLQ